MGFGKTTTNLFFISQQPGKVLYQSIEGEGTNLDLVHEAFTNVMELIMKAPYLHSTHNSKNVLIFFLGLMNVDHDGKTLRPPRKWPLFCLFPWCILLFNHNHLMSKIIFTLEKATQDIAKMQFIVKGTLLLLIKRYFIKEEFSFEQQKAFEEEFHRCYFGPFVFCPH